MSTLLEHGALAGAAPHDVLPDAGSIALPVESAETSRRILRLGTTLFLLGLLSGFLIPLTANPRVALSSHLEGVMNGTFLLVLGVLWPRLRLGPRSLRALFWLAVYGTFANWAATLLAAVVGAGATMMPIAAGGFTGTATQEALIAASLLSLSAAMLVVCPMMIWGLRRPGD